MIIVIVITSFHRFPNYMRTGTPWTEETLQPFEIDVICIVKNICLYTVPVTCQGRERCPSP